MAMSLAQQFTGLRCCSPLSSSPLSKPFSAPNNHKRNPLPIVASVALSNAQTKERQNLKQPFEDAYERCRTVPMEGVSFTLEEFDSALDKYDFDSEIGTKAEEMAQTFRQRIAQAEAMARADMLRFQPESGLTLSSDGILGPFL